VLRVPPQPRAKRLSLAKAGTYLETPRWVVQFLIRMGQLRTHRGRLDFEDLRALRPRMGRLRRAAEAWRSARLEFPENLPPASKN
jgi:hypothetical protein